MIFADLFKKLTQILAMKIFLNLAIPNYMGFHLEWEIAKLSRVEASMKLSWLYSQLYPVSW